MKMSDTQMQSVVNRSVNLQKIITFQTYSLSEYGENVLKEILASILDKYCRMDLFDIAYASTRELILNATKANLKRIIFDQLNLDLNNDSDYEQGMQYICSKYI